MKPKTNSDHAVNSDNDSEDLTSDDDWTEVGEEEEGDANDDDDDDDAGNSSCESDGTADSVQQLASDTEDVPLPICKFEDFTVKTAKVARPKNRHPETYSLLKTSGDIRIYEPDGSANTETELPGFAKFGRQKEVYYGRVVATASIPEVLKSGKYCFHMLTPAQDWARVRKIVRRYKIDGKPVALTDDLKRLLMAASGMVPSGSAISTLNEGKYKVLMEANGGGLSHPPLSHGTHVAESKKRKAEGPPEGAAKKAKPAANMFAAAPFVAAASKPKHRAKKPEPTNGAESPRLKAKPKQKSKPKPKPVSGAASAVGKETPAPTPTPTPVPVSTNAPPEPRLVKVMIEFMVPRETAMGWTNESFRS